MARWLRILLFALGFAAIALATLPWWLGVALRPVLRNYGVTFQGYERSGYAHFQLTDARYAGAQVEVTAKLVRSPTPLVWLARRWGGNDPVIQVENWVVQRPPQATTVPLVVKPNSLAGWPDLHAAFARIVPTISRWLPQAQLTAGELRGFGPDLKLSMVDWRDSTLSVEGLGAADRTFAVVIASGANGALVLTAQTAGKEGTLRLEWTGAEFKGTALLWQQPLQLLGHFPARGWMPVDASAVAANWILPAARLKLGPAYALIRGDARVDWRDGAFAASASATAEAAAGTKAPALSAQATAHGTAAELTLTALSIDAPFATARLTAPIAFSLAEPTGGQSAHLVLQADLSKLPGVEARGRVQGTVTVAGPSAAARQDFDLECTDLVTKDFALPHAHVRGSLRWPELQLEEFTVQLDEKSRIAAHGAVNWQTRELTGASLEAQVGPAWFARWLPAGVTWDAAALTATAEGPLAALRHQGSVNLTRAQWPPLRPVKISSAWQGLGTKVEILSARAGAGESTVEFAGTLDPTGLQFSKLVFAPRGQLAWQLVAPAQLSWSPVWQISDLQLAGPASRLALKGRGGPDGFFNLTAAQVDSSWLQDWIGPTGPGWRLQALTATGRVDGSILEFATELTAQIEMSPQPAEVRLVASGGAQGVQLKEFTVVDSGRALTRASGRLPLVWSVTPAPHWAIDAAAPLEIEASTEPDSPLWTALAAATGLTLTKPAASLSLKGTPHQPAGELRFKAAGVSADPARFNHPWPDLADLDLALHFDRASVQLTSLSAKVEGQNVQANGHVPMDGSRWRQLWREPGAFDWSKLEGHLEVPDADLAPIARRFPKFVAAQGRMRARMEFAPGGKWAGELRLTNATSRPLPPFSTLQEINADLALADRTLTIRRLTAKLGGEPVSLDGSVALAADGSPRLDLRLQGKNLPLVRNTGLLVRNDLDLQVHTDAAGQTRIAGTVTLRECLVLANLDLRSLLPVGLRGVTRQPPYFSVSNEPFRQWQLAVEVHGPNAVRLRTTVFNGTGSARFHLGGTLGEPRAVGELTVGEGQVLFPFATFAVQLGTIRLREADPFHAVINLSASSQRRDYQLRLAVTGELPSPNIILTSNPALSAEEVLLMVTTGQAPTSGTTPASSSQQRLALLGAYLGRGWFQELGVGGENRLEINTGMQVSEQGRETYGFEYKLSDRWSLTGEYDQFDSYNAGLKWRAYAEESKPDAKK